MAVNHEIDVATKQEVDVVVVVALRHQRLAFAERDRFPGSLDVGCQACVAVDAFLKAKSL